MPIESGLSALQSQHDATISTGMPRLDRIAVGFGPGELWVVHRQRVSVAAFLAQMACLVTARQTRVALLSRERPSSELWRLIVAEWCELAPADVARASLSDDAHAVFTRRVREAKDAGLVVSGSEFDWRMGDAEHARVVFIDGPSPRWPKKDYCGDGDWRWIDPAAARDVARAHDATVVVGVYDEAEVEAWSRYADTIIRLGRPIDGDHSRTGETDIAVSSPRYMARANFELFWMRRGGGVHFVDPATTYPEILGDLGDAAFELEDV